MNKRWRGPPKPKRGLSPLHAVTATTSTAMFDFLCDLPPHEEGKLLEAERRDDDRGTTTTEDPYERFLQMLPNYRVPWTLTTPRNAGSVAAQDDDADAHAAAHR